LGLISTKEHPSLHQNGPEITWVIIFNFEFYLFYMN